MNHGWIRRGKAATTELRLTRIARIDSNFDRKAKTAKRRFGDFVIFAISAVKRLGTKQQLAPLFDNYDLKYEILSFTYIGRDNQYAVARVKQSTQKLSGPAFRHNILDMVQVFRQEKGQWKFWNQVILEVTYINQ